MMSINEPTSIFNAFTRSRAAALTGRGACAYQRRRAVSQSIG